jgi:hypothetical protein
MTDIEEPCQQLVSYSYTFKARLYFLLRPRRGPVKMCFIKDAESLREALKPDSNDLLKGEKPFFVIDQTKLKWTRDPDEALEVKGVLTGKDVPWRISFEDAAISTQLNFKIEKKLLGVSVTSGFPDIDYCYSGMEGTEQVDHPYNFDSNFIASHYPAPRKPISKKLRHMVWLKQNGHCAYCGCELPEKEMQVDHIVSHMKNKGKDDLENYQPSCAVCNRVKYIDTLEEFRGTIRHCAEIHHRPKREIEADSDRICHKYGLDGDGWKTKPIVFYFEKDKK